MKLYLVATGASAGNLPGRMTGWSEHPLTRLGTAQARRVAARLAPLGPMPVYTSDLPRALETAAPHRRPVARLESATAARRRRSGCFPDRRLREIDLGDYEGRSWDDFSADRDLAAAFAARAARHETARRRISGDGPRARDRRLRRDRAGDPPSPASSLTTARSARS